MHQIPEGYTSSLTLKQTQVGIKRIKDYFEDQVALLLNCVRVSTPLFVSSQSGLNDHLNNVEKPVSFDVSEGAYGNSLITRQMEASCSKTIWIQYWPRFIYGYECHSSI